MREIVKPLRVARLPSQDRGVPGCDETAPLALKGCMNKRGTTANVSLADLLVDKFNNFIRQPYRDLLAHPVMVPIWDVGRYQ